jgi:regulation of enolase protein 1 (concanavalin A-like superfamily)
MGSTSPDGEHWTAVGSATLALPSTAQIGLAACSRIQGSTTVMFDHVSNISSATKTSETPKAGL